MSLALVPYVMHWQILCFPGSVRSRRRLNTCYLSHGYINYLSLRKTKSCDAARLGRKHEIELIFELLEWEDTDGVIGKDAKAGLQRLPSSVYWSGLGLFGIRRYQGSLDQYHRSLDGFYQGRRQVHASTEDGIVELFKPQSNWHDGLPPIPDDFPLGVSLELDESEAEYLRQQIMSTVPGTFIAFLVDQGKWWEKTDYPWEHPQVSECSRHLQGQLHHADLFSLIMLGAALLYNLMLAEKRASGPGEGDGQGSELVERYRDRMVQWHEDINSRRAALNKWVNSRSVFWDAINRVNARVPVPTIQFVDKWIDIALAANDVHALIDAQTARNLIQHRERQLKRSLARLDNTRALEMWGGAAGTGRLTYRWNVAQDIIQDILRGLGKESG